MKLPTLCGTTVDFLPQQPFLQHKQRRRARHSTGNVCQGSATGLEVLGTEAQQSTGQQKRQQQQQQHQQQRLQVSWRTECRGLAACSRRAALPVIGLALLGSALSCQRAAADEEASLPASPDTPSNPVASSSQETEFVTYSNQSLRYSLIRPANWEAVSDIGADAVFEDPEQRSNRVGITVYNVSVTDLEDFGGLEAVGEQLLAAERVKDSTQETRMLWQQERTFDDRQYYDYSYLLDTSRGRWQVFSSVALRGRSLFILDASMGCGRAVGSVCKADTAEVLKQVASSFKVL